MPRVQRGVAGLRLAAFYHVWAPGRWEEPLAEFLNALGDFTGPLYLGLVGAPKERRTVLSAVTRNHKIATVADSGYEQITLAAVREYALKNGGAVLYAHTKGAARDYALQRPWRREVTEQLVLPWRENLAALEDADVVGSSWQDWGDEPSGFLANFWMARCDYLRTLPPPSTERRTAAETWVGSSVPEPRVYDLAPRRMRWVPTDGRGDRKIDVPEGYIAIMITETGESVLAVQIVPAEWLPDIHERMVWRVLAPEEAQAWRDSYARRETCWTNVTQAS